MERVTGSIRLEPPYGQKHEPTAVKVEINLATRCPGERICSRLLPSLFEAIRMSDRLPERWSERCEDSLTSDPLSFRGDALVLTDEVFDSEMVISVVKTTCNMALNSQPAI